MLVWFLCAAILSFVLTAVVRRVALRYRIVDIPNEARKIHTKPVPLMGGVALYASFAIVLLVAAGVTGRIVGTISWQMIGGVLLGGLILIIGGVLDDVYRLRPSQQIWFPVIATLVVIVSGVGVSKLTNPFGGVIVLTALLSALVVFPYLMVTTYTTKLFDGLDGLVGGMTAIGAFLIMGLALTTKYFQPDVAFIAVIAAGACIGFLPWNFYPAKIFLGEGGALFAGYLLGVLSIISGAKIAVVMLALGVAVTDAGWVILRRAVWEKSSVSRADRKHLHHRLLDAGLSQRTAVILLWCLSAVFGTSALFLQSSGKVAAFAFLAFLTVTVGVLTVSIARRR